MPKQPEITVLVNEISPRDYFAAAALTALLANTEHDFINASAYAQESYLFADAMLKERQKEQSQ